MQEKHELYNWHRVTIYIVIASGLSMLFALFLFTRVKRVR
jgi:hypothetical protein